MEPATFERVEDQGKLRSGDEWNSVGFHVDDARTDFLKELATFITDDYCKRP